MKKWIPLIFIVLLSIHGCYITPPGDDDDGSEETTEEGPVIEPTGYEEGDIPYDFELKDQNGDYYTLYEWFEYVILVDISEMWCEPCQWAAEDSEELYQEYKDLGFIYLTIICQDYNGFNVSDSDIDGWVETYGITYPVLKDPGCTITNEWIGSLPYSMQGYPTFWIMDREMVIYEIISGYFGSPRPLKTPIEELLGLD